MVFGGKFRITRCNSKASYLPRQSREKLNIDPDHGIYKLTLTSNEDCINHTHTVATSPSFHATDLLATAASKCNNLPDVLPVGVKVHNGNNTSPRYGSNNNLNLGHLQNHHHKSIASPQTAPANPQSHHHPTSGYSMKSVFNFNMNRHSSNSPTSPTPPQSTVASLAYHRTGLANSSESLMTGNAALPPPPPTSSTKYVSQSCIDLKKSTHILTNNSDTNKIMELEPPIEPLNRQSPYAIRHEFVNRKLSLEDRTNNPSSLILNRSGGVGLGGVSPSAKKESATSEKIIRKDSLKENIDKITQLQSKLMSAHVHEQERNSVNLARESSFRNSLKTDDIRRPPSANALERKNSLNESTTNKTNVPQQIETITTSVASPIVVAEINETTILPATSNISDIDNLKLLQRTEIVLRLNAPTSEAASQTDDPLDVFGMPIITSVMTATETENESSSDKTSPKSCCIPIRTGSSLMELDCDKLSQDLVKQLSPNDRLHHILAPKMFRSSGDYITGLYNPYITPRLVKKDVSTSTPDDSPVHSHSSTPVNDASAYFSIAEPLRTTPKFSYQQQPPTLPKSPPPIALLQSSLPLLYSREITNLVNGDDGSIDPEHDDDFSSDLTRQKEQLIVRLSRKIAILTNEQSVIAEEATANEMLGVDVARKVSEQIRPVDASKFRSYVDDVGHITMLLLSLSSRLAKTENELQAISGDDASADKKILDLKRDRLTEQLDEAKRLKDDIDRRGSAVCRILEKHLSIEDYADYDYFVNMKAKLIVDAREIADKIKLGEDQLAALKETLVHSEC